MSARRLAVAMGFATPHIAVGLAATTLLAASAFGWVAGLVALGGHVLLGVLAFTRAGEQFVMTELMKMQALDLGELPPGYLEAVSDLVALHGASVTDFDWYVTAGDEEFPNAMASGSHAVALSRGILTMCHEDRANPEHLAAIIAHELGHHHLGHSRAGAAVIVWGAPVFWCLGIGANLIRRWKETEDPDEKVGLMTTAFIAAAVAFAAITYAINQHPSGLGMSLAAMAVSGLLVAASARASRLVEYEADAYAAKLGFTDQLFDYLAYCGDGECGIFSTHPLSSDRARRLDPTRDFAPAE